MPQNSKLTILAEAVATGAGELRVVVRPGLSPAEEIRAAGIVAAQAGRDPVLAAMDQRLAILDRLLAQVRA